MQFGNEVKWIENTALDESSVWDSIMSGENCKKAKRFHATFPQYCETPLVSLGNRATALGLGGFYVKDESYRFGLNAFKVLGCSYAIGCVMAERFGIDGNEMTYDTLKEKMSGAGITFYTATDGNHGRAVAWTARELGQQARVYMPKGTKEERVENVRKENAVVTVENFVYDRCVEKASREAEMAEGVLVQDTAWEGYEKIPALIMQGYGTMADEATVQMPAHPTHVFLQSGVGSMAAAITGYFASFKTKPIIVIVEPNAADCGYRSALAGERVSVDGELDTIMAGLACGEVSTVAWDILKNHADFFVSVPDEVSKRGMRMLAKPTEGDTVVISGESGAVCPGLVDAIMTEPELAELKKALKLNVNSQVLCFSTEGATDKENWNKIVN